MNHKHQIKLRITQVINLVLQTNDYAVFKHVGGNRAVNKLHVSRAQTIVPKGIFTIANYRKSTNADNRRTAPF
jgi:hypothetical protein